MAQTTLIECDLCGASLPTGIQAAAYVTLWHRVGPGDITELQFCYGGKVDEDGARLPSCGDQLCDAIDAMVGSPITPLRPVPVPMDNPLQPDPMTGQPAGPPPQ